MLSLMRRHLSYANVVATLALAFAMGGTAVAANHYLITSTKQIAPRVLNRLKGRAGPTGATGAAGPGVRAVRQEQPAPRARRERREARAPPSRRSSTASAQARRSRPAALKQRASR